MIFSKFNFDNMDLFIEDFQTIEIQIDKQYETLNVQTDRVIS